MFEYIKGRVASIKDDYIVLEANSVGYKIFTSVGTISQVSLDEEILIYIYFNLRDDGVYLYGFYREEELDMFNLLILVSSVGPKTALGVLSTLTPGELKMAILNKDLKTLTKAPGIGKKTAERIVLELKDRVEKVEVSLSQEDRLGLIDKVDQAIEGLESLGYSSREVKEVLVNFDLDDMSEEDIIKLVLKNISH